MHTLSGRVFTSSQVMKNGLGSLSGSMNLDMAATRQVILVPSGRNRRMGAVSAFNRAAMAAAPSGVSTAKVTSVQGLEDVSPSAASVIFLWGQPLLFLLCWATGASIWT